MCAKLSTNVMATPPCVLHMALGLLAAEGLPHLIPLSSANIRPDIAQSLYPAILLRQLFQARCSPDPIAPRTPAAPWTGRQGLQPVDTAAFEAGSTKLYPPDALDPSG